MNLPKFDYQAPESISKVCSLLAQAGERAAIMAGGTDLMVQMMQSDDGTAEEELKQLIVETALRHQLISKYTSRIAVEEQVVVEGGEMVSVKVPVNAPKGWTMYATATNETLQLLIGIACLMGSFVLRRMCSA